MKTRCKCSEVKLPNQLRQFDLKYIEYIQPRSPDRIAYIKAFNLILETEVLKFQYYRNFEEAYASIYSFIEFYNNRRLHGSLKYLSPKMFIDGITKGEIISRVVAV